MITQFPNPLIQFYLLADGRTEILTQRILSDNNSHFEEQAWKLCMDPFVDRLIDTYIDK
jgi:hypothetical protein